MHRRKVSIERRQQKRFKVVEGAFAALVNPTSKLGQIKDISKLGLSFCYIDNEDESDNAQELKIILGNRGLCLDKVPFNKVADFELESEFSFSSLRMRQFGLQFGKLTPDQKIRLEDFIRNHTSGEA